MIISKCIVLGLICIGTAKSQCGLYGRIANIGNNQRSCVYDLSKVGGASTLSFANITAGNNTTGLIMNSGGVLSVNGTGIISANQINGISVPVSAALVGTDSNSRFIAKTLGSPDQSIQFNNSNSLNGLSHVKSDGSGNLEIITVPDPTIPAMLALAGLGAGNIDNGTHCYAYQYVTLSGSTNLSISNVQTASITVTDNTVNGQVSVTVPASADTRVTSVYVYRSLTGGDCNGTESVLAFYWITAIASNGGSFTDNNSDATITGNGTILDNAIGSGNTTGTIATNNNPMQINDQGGINLSSSYGVPNSILFTNSVGFFNSSASFPNNATQYLNGNGSFSTPSNGILQGVPVTLGGSLLTALSCASTTSAVTGAATGMSVVITPDTYPGDGIIWKGYISNPDEVTVKVCALAALTPTSSVYEVRVIP